MGKQASLVLSDELLSQFYAFKENGKYDQRHGGKVVALL